MDGRADAAVVTLNYGYMNWVRQSVTLISSQTIWIGRGNKLPLIITTTCRRRRRPRRRRTLLLLVASSTSTVDNTLIATSLALFWRCSIYCMLVVTMYFDFNDNNFSFYPLNFKCLYFGLRIEWGKGPSVHGCRFLPFALTLLLRYS